MDGLAVPEHGAVDDGVAGRFADAYPDHVAADGVVYQLVAAAAENHIDAVVPVPGDGAVEDAVGRRVVHVYAIPAVISPYIVREYAIRDRVVMRFGHVQAQRIARSVDIADGAVVRHGQDHRGVSP